MPCWLRPGRALLALCARVWLDYYYHSFSLHSTHYESFFLIFAFGLDNDKYQEKRKEKKMYSSQTGETGEYEWPNQLKFTSPPPALPLLPPPPPQCPSVPTARRVTVRQLGISRRLAGGVPHHMH
jgi:hypothetical protein